MGKIAVRPETGRDRRHLAAAARVGASAAPSGRLHGRRMGSPERGHPVSTSREPADEADHRVVP
jgi:hypothetical protein